MDNLDEALKTSKDEDNDQGTITTAENPESGKIFPEQQEPKPKPEPEQDLELQLEPEAYTEPEAKPVPELEPEAVADTDVSSKKTL